MQTLTNSHYLERCRTFTEYHTLCVNSFLWNTHTPLATTTTTSLPNTPSSTTQHYLTHIHKHHHDTHTLKMNFSLQQDGGEIKNVVLSTIERWMIVEKGTYVDQPKFGHILTPTLSHQLTHYGNQNCFVAYASEAGLGDNLHILMPYWCQPNIGT